MERMRMGPIGDSFGDLFGNETLWDETGRNVISLIIVTYANYGATSIQFGFIEDGALVMSKTYGSYGSSTRIVRLNHETEFVTGMTGETYDGHISSLTFHTNLKKHEVFHLTFDYGKSYPPQKIEFHSGILERCELEGFFGACDDSNELSTISFYVRHIIPDVKKIKLEDVGEGYSNLHVGEEYSDF